MLSLLKRFGKKKEAESPPATTTSLEIHVYDSNHPIWKEFAKEVKAAKAENEGENNWENEFAVDYTVPGELAYELADLCEREGALELTAEKIMYFSEATNKVLLLKKDGELIGFLMMSLYDGPSQPKIWLVCVSSTEKGKQYSKYLIDQAKRMAIEAGKTSIHLEALSRTVGKKVYTAQGFAFNESDGENMTAFLEQPKKRKQNTRRYRKNRKSTRRNQRRQH